MRPFFLLPILLFFGCATPSQNVDWYECREGVGKHHAKLAGLVCAPYHGEKAMTYQLGYREDGMVVWRDNGEASGEPEEGANSPTDDVPEPPQE